jgi:hypothetical protein
VNRAVFLTYCFTFNNTAGTILATEGVKDVSILTSSERGESVSIIACCNAERTFVSPVQIMKCMRKNAEFIDGLPPGPKVFMNAKFSYDFVDLFFKWLNEDLAPRKCPSETHFM